MQNKIRIVSLITVLGLAILFGVYWFQSYLKGSKASTVPGVAFAIADGKKINPGDSFDILVQIIPNSKTFYSVDLGFTYDPTKVQLQNEADPIANLTALSTTNSDKIDVKFITSGTSVDPATGKIKIMAVRENDTNSPFIGGTDPISIVRVSLMMKASAALPITFAWDASSKTSLPDVIEKTNLTYTGIEPTTAPKVIPYTCGSDDFSGATINATKWNFSTSGGGSVGTGGQATFYIPGNTTNKGTSISSKNVVEGDFSAEVTIKGHSTKDNKLASNLFFQFGNSDWSKAVSIFKAYNKSPGELAFGWTEGVNVWKDLGKNDGIDHNTTVKVKIERMSGTFKLYYDKLDGAGYKLAKQLDNYYTGQGTIAMGVDMWGPDFPQASGIFDDYNLTCYKPDVSVGPVGVPTATPKPGAATPYPTTGIVKCGVDVCQTGFFCYYPPISDCVVGETCIDMFSEPYCKQKDGVLELTPTPVLGTAGTVASTTRIYERQDTLYINSIMTYPAPLRYEQPLKLEKGTYSLVMGARMYAKRGTGLVLVVQCNESSCGKNENNRELHQNDVIYRTPTFPEKTEFSELRQMFTISDSVSNKQLVLRVYCEDGSECDIDYISLEDAWGSERLQNPQFADSQLVNNPRKQPVGWEVDATANLYGSVDPAYGNRGALMINNSAK